MIAGFVAFSVARLSDPRFFRPPVCSGDVSSPAALQVRIILAIQKNKGSKSRKAS